uniref:Transcription factor HES-5 n=1 Tax=Astyanax mexicanus TaxID=7994 RepID=A0A3B1IMT1_ASTMX
MTPAITSAPSISKELLPLNNKLRKPVVEKMRRDRINSSIEQLKTLLTAEFLNQQPDSKLEKADILEMTVSFLRRQQQQQQQQQPAFSSRSAAVNQGFSRCVHELLHFLSKDEVKTQSQRKLMNHVLQNLQHPAVSKNSLEAVQLQMSSSDQQTIIFSKEENLVESALWRPW